MDVVCPETHITRFQDQRQSAVLLAQVFRQFIFPDPVKEVIEQKEDGKGWAYVKYHGFKGWMLDCFLVEDPPGSTPDPDPEPSPAPDPEPEPDPDPDDDPTGEMLSVWAENGKPVKLRNQPSTGSSLYDEIPINTVVTLEKYGDDWCRVSYGYRRGWYIMTKYLTWG